ncbi:hypothetical protein E2C01_015972 [Portunus trituberculatus]|uniref:Uncharacterized protein n=1 Tax=Portunus trituberculatus TaxID=210409 RepID=A0A5B7DMV4_PORTR|nr:hypothetical protein [Portunus trituberculatus]
MNSDVLSQSSSLIECCPTLLAHEKLHHSHYNGMGGCLNASPRESVNSSTPTRSNVLSRVSWAESACEGISKEMREGGRLGSWCVEGGTEPRVVMCVEAGVSSEGCNDGNWCVVDGGPGEQFGTEVGDWLTDTGGSDDEKASDMRCGGTLYCKELITVSLDGTVPVNKLPPLCPLRVLSSVELRLQHQ